MENQQIKVSDWSQPFKLAFGVVFLVGMLFIGAQLVEINQGVNQQRLGFQGQPISYTPSMGSNASIAVTSTVRLVLSADSGIQLLSVSNSGFWDAWISATSTNLINGTGLLIKASTTQVFAGDNLWTGPVYVIGAGTTTISTFKL